MPFLNWKDLPRLSHQTPAGKAGNEAEGRGASQALGAGKVSRTRLVLELKQVQLQELVSQVEELYLGAEGKEQLGPELRIQLPENWLLFWKPRAEGNRVLLAHPNDKEWVVTCALDRETCQSVVLSLKNLSHGQSLNLSESILLNPVSNLELVWVLI